MDTKNPITIGIKDDEPTTVVAEWWWRIGSTGTAEPVPLPHPGVNPRDIIEVRMTVGPTGVHRLDIESRHPMFCRLTTRFLRGLPLASMERRIREYVLLANHLPNQQAAFIWNADRPGRAGRDVRDYARVAARYVELLSQPEPTKVLAAELFISTSQLRNVLLEARNRKLLTKAPPGRAGGQLTSTAIKILTSESEST